MKTLLTITFLFFMFFCFGQTQKKIDALYDLTISYRPATLKIIKDTILYTKSVINNISKTTYLDIKPGHYKIEISREGQTTFIRDSIIVAEGQKLVLSFKIDGPCLYDHPVGYVPTCPKKHIDSIIPIVYGLIATKGDTFIKNKKDEKIRYAGCITTECDPQFYCKQHEIEF